MEIVITLSVSAYVSPVKGQVIESERQSRAFDTRKDVYPRVATL